ncbi:MAG: SpoIIE family protein phosphatase [Planctomycetes bacterium]|nr:SpoIIE family protein phosphatase [Planctomycetota bacterium]
MSVPVETTPSAAAPKLRQKVLIVDDQASLRALHGAYVQHLGHAVVFATNGLEALESFRREQPDCVLLDLHTPGIDGVGVCRRIRSECGDRYVAVILLTGDDGVATVTRCLEAGADDCWVKPLKPQLLGPKLESLNRIRALYERLRGHQEELAAYRVATLREQELAKSLFARVVDRGQPAANVRRMIQAADVFHGDIALTAWRPNGAQLILVGDFTGHGLQAALGAIPVADIFHSMARVGFAAPDIVAEINRRLFLCLPRNLFLSACVLEIHHAESFVLAWNGGLPTLFVQREGAGLVAEIPPHHVPLGILPESQFDASCQTIPIKPGDRVFAASDGVIETANRAGEQFGEERLRAALCDDIGGEGRFEELVRRIEAFRNGAEKLDDVTLVEVLCGPAVVPRSDQNSAKSTREALTWKLALELEGQALHQVDPIPLCLRAVQEIQGLEGHKEALHLVLSELFNNALDHGVLGRDSRLKETPDGFLEFYASRDRLLETLHSGKVALELAHEPTPQGGRLTIDVVDSGPGFERGAAPQAGAHSGRGIALVESFCDSLEYRDAGRRAHARFSWTREAQSEERPQ